MNMDKETKAGIDVRIVLRYRIPVLILILAATVIVGFGLKNLKMAADPLASLYAQGHPYAATLKAIKDFTPEARMLVCIVDVKHGDIYNTATLKKIDSITKGLVDNECLMPGGIVSLTKGMMHYYNSTQGLNIESVLGTQWPETPEQFADLKRRVAINPMGPGKYVAYDGTAVMITAKLADINQIAQQAYDELPEKSRPPFAKFKAAQSAQFNAKLVKALEALKAKEDDANHTLYFMGQEVLTHQMTEMGATHIGAAAGIMCAILIAGLFFAFRSLAGVVAPLIAMGTAVVWSLGIYAWTGMELNPLLVLFPLLLGLLTVAVCVPMLSAYHRAAQVESDREKIVMEAFNRVQTRRAILGAALVMAGMCAAPVAAMKALGAMGIFWAVGAYVAVVLLTPILLVFLPAPSKAVPISTMESAVMDKTAGSWKLAGLGLGIVVLVAGSFAFTRLEIDGNVPGTDYISSSHPWNQCFNLLARKFMGPQQLLVYVKADKPGGLVEPEAMNAIGDFSSYLVNECGARESIAYDMMIRMCRWTLMDGNPKWMTLPLTRQEIEGLAGTVYEQGGVEDFIDPTFTQGTISPFFPNRDSRSIDGYAEKIQAYIDRHPVKGLTFALGGGLLGMTKPQNDATRVSYPRVVFTALFTALVLGVLLWRSPLKGLGIALSIGVVQAALWIVMLISGLPLSLAVLSVVAPAMALGFVHGSAIVESTPSGGATVMGLLIFAACLPFFFIGMKFQAVMLLMFGVFALVQTVAGLLIIPALAGGRRS